MCRKPNFPPALVSLPFLSHRLLCGSESTSPTWNGGHLRMWQLSHSHADQKEPVPRGKGSSAPSCTAGNPGTRPESLTRMMRKKVVQCLTGRSWLECQVRGSAASRPTVSWMGVREPCHPQSNEPKPTSPTPLHPPPILPWVLFSGTGSKVNLCRPEVS